MLAFALGGGIKPRAASCSCTIGEGTAGELLQRAGRWLWIVLVLVVGFLVIVLRTVFVLSPPPPLGWMVAGWLLIGCLAFASVPRWRLGMRWFGWG